MELEFAHFFLRTDIEINEDIPYIYDGKVYTPSDLVKDFFNNSFIRPYMQLVVDNKWCGYSKEEVLNDIIKRGKADFDEPHISNEVQKPNIDPEKKVLAYCFWNMRLHFYTFYHLLDLLNNDGEFNYYFKKKLKSRAIQFFDIGCGPLTCPLALGEFHYSKYNSKLKIDYCGIDISNAMLDTAKKYSFCEVFDKQSNFEFHSDVSSILVKIDKQLIIINCSFLFFNIEPNSEWVSIYSMFINSIILSNMESDIILIYQNPDYDCPAYEVFKTKVIDLKAGISGKNTINYQHSKQKKIDATVSRYELLFNTKAATYTGLFRTGVRAKNNES